MYDFLFDPKTGEPGLVVYVCLAASVMLALDWLFRAMSRSRNYRQRVNKRLRRLEEGADRQETLVQLRRERGLSDDGRYRMPIIWFNRLVLQSGVTIKAGRLAVLLLVLGTVIVMLGTMLGHSPLLAGAVALLLMIGLPLGFLTFLRNRRRKKFAEQLPDAIDVMVRSLRAGHPVPIAVSLVSREMADPIGTEFGITSDEIAYGLDLEESLLNMTARVGDPDLSFLVTAVSVQSQTGGNLGEVLGNLSKVLRDRFKLSRKVVAMSAEGKLSAIALSSLPVGIFLMLNVIAPSFYGDIKDDPIITPALIITFTVWATGVLTIRRLVNFKY